MNIKEHEFHRKTEFAVSANLTGKTVSANSCPFACIRGFISLPPA